MKIDGVYQLKFGGLICQNTDLNNQNVVSASRMGVEASTKSIINGDSQNMMGYNEIDHKSSMLDTILCGFAHRYFNGEQEDNALDVGCGGLPCFATNQNG